MNEETKIYIIELLIEINNIFTCLSDQLNILYFKFEPLLKDIPETSKSPPDSTPDINHICTDIQTNLHNINHILNTKLTSFAGFPERQRFKNMIDMNTENIQKNLNELTGIYK